MAELEIKIDKLEADLNNIIFKLDAITKQIGQANTAFKQFKVPSQATTQVNSNNTAVKESNALQKEAKRLASALEKQQAKLAQSQSDVNEQLIKYRFETTEANKRAKERAILSSRLSTEYQKEQVRLTQLRRTYADLALKQTQGIKLSKAEERELKDVTSQINKKDAALKKVDAQMGIFNRNVGNYSSGLKSLTGMIGAAVVAFGAYSALEIGKEIFEQVKEIDSLNKALQQVTGSSENFYQAQSFILELADETGIEINKLQQSYTKFYAAAKNTNLTLSETQDIFRQVAKAGAVMGLSTEQVNGALTALEQMLSKGKVQAEEIRGQLGERLPGAFQILAKSMGLTTAELDKQLDMGNVIADEVLPKFAKQLEKTFGLDQVEKVDTLNAAQGRLSNSWNEFIRNVEEGNGVLSKIMGSTLNLITDTIEGWDKIINPEKIALRNTYNETLARENKYYEEQIGNTERLARIKAESATSNLANLKEELEGLQATRKAIDQSTSSYSGLKGVIAGVFVDNTKDAKELDEQIKALNISIKGNEAVLFAANQQLKENTEETNENAKAQGNLQKFLFGTIAYYENLIKELKSQQREVSTTKEQWQDYQRQIEETEATLLRLIRTFKGMEDASSVGEITPFGRVDTNIEPAEDNSLEEYQKRQEMKLAVLKGFTEAEQALISQSLQRIGDMYGVDASKFEFLYDNKKNTVEDYAQGALEVTRGINNALLQSELSKIDAQIEANNEYYGDLIDAAEGNERQQELLALQKEQRENELLNKKAKKERDAAIFESIINTAVAVVQALPNLPLAAIVGGLGAIQTGLIASQPLPQYKTGRKGGKDEWAILGDGFKNEPILDKQGNLKAISPNKPTMMHLDNGDTVLPSMNDLQRASVMASVDSMQKDYNSYDAAAALEARLSQMIRNSNKDVISSLKKAKFINQNYNKVDLGNEMKKQKYR